jgi:hypothetical protein
VTEAPPPCEACGMYPGVRPMDRYPSHHALLAAKDAEIAELRAQRELLAGQLALADGAWGPKEWIKWARNGGRWAKSQGAALAPKVSHD